ncbi:hypothetical protein C8F04DRAFT_1069910 [Mycena alexandri]|uniref:Uncharacterized protein n=1 Tax=Mycena alexandri TaxID=1745969 RepID=A0AAD6XGY3_9AGAR|nr:hypothetical protein C8F04DRAFT_1069910 [Mycena alexandri]
MPPAPRSTPTTPGATRTVNPTATTESPVNTPRKSPHCKTCGRPRKGHPLRACETDSPLVQNATPIRASPLKNTTPARTNPSPSNLIDGLVALQLEERDRQEKRERHQAARAQPKPTMQSLPSISTITGELLESLKKPGLLVDDGSDYTERREAVTRWREKGDAPTATGTSKPKQPSNSVVPASSVEPERLDAPLDDFTPTKKRLRGTSGK